MLIGLTYDLKDDYLNEGYSEEASAEFDREDTILGIESALISLGYETCRIGNVKQLIKELSSGKKWDLVFNIAEGMFGVGRESLVPALLDAYQIPYVFSDPLVLAVTLQKGIAKTIVKSHGIPTADFAVVENEADLNKINIQYPLFIKPSSEGTGKGITEKSIVHTFDDLETGCKRLLKDYSQSVLVEKYLSGREFTAGLIGTGEDTKCIGVMEVMLKESIKENLIYSYFNKANYESILDYRIPETEMIDACSILAVEAWRCLGCRDGGRLDIRMDDMGVLNFIEVNPLAGLNPVHSDLPIIARLNNISYESIIDEIMKSARKRIGI